MDLYNTNYDDNGNFFVSDNRVSETPIDQRTVLRIIKRISKKNCQQKLYWYIKYFITLYSKIEFMYFSNLVLCIILFVLN